MPTLAIGVASGRAVSVGGGSTQRDRGPRPPELPLAKRFGSLYDRAVPS
jgi:hypothetical protein